MRLKLVFPIIFISLFSCKKEKDIDSLRIVRPNINEESFNVELNVEVLKDDTFSLYYTTDGSTDFKDNPIWKEVEGNTSAQSITYTLPKKIIPTQLRLDFGMNPDQETIKLNYVKLKYKEKEKTIAISELGSFFRADESKCVFNTSTGEITAKIIDNKRQFPSLYPHETALEPEIQKLIQ